MSQYKQNWEDLGRNIQDAVDRAINSQDFQKMNQKIQQVISQATNMQGSVFGTKGSSKPVKKLYGKTVWKNIKAALKIFFGGMLAFNSLIVAIVMLVASEPVSGLLAGVVFVLTLTAVGTWMTLNGINTARLLQRFKSYCRALGNKTHCTLSILASCVGKSEEFVRRDLRKMIDKGLFLEGHLNKEQTHFLSSHESYQYYEQSRKQLERQRQEAEAARTAKETDSSELGSILERGNRYIDQLHKCNEDIPGEEISEKISRIELLVQRIFARVREHPEVIPDLKKMMEYYLPMTVKLLRAYADMDMQPVHGETILASKKEIEDTLDTINLAFEKLLDDLFVDTAMDISSDISVLNTLLAQEGLVEDEISGMKAQ